MSDIFELMEIATDEVACEKEVQLGIRVRISNHEAVCPVCRPCRTYGALAAELKAIREHLTRIEKQAEAVFMKTGNDHSPFPDAATMTAHEIWSLLAELDDEASFVKSYNGLEEAKRREVAEHVLTQCNIFSGKAAVFSSRYDNESGLLL